MTRTRDPLEPLSTVVRLSSWLAYTAAAFAVLLLAFGPDGLTSSGPRDQICFDGMGRLINGDYGDFPSKPGVTATTTVSNACLDSPSTMLWVADQIDQWLWLFWFAGALLLLTRLLRTATQEGPFAAAVPGRLRLLGWYIVGGAAVATLAMTWAHAGLINGMFAMSIEWPGLWWKDYPIWTLFVGAGVLSFARILRIGTTMREDLEGTV